MGKYQPFLFETDLSQLPLRPTRANDAEGQTQDQLVADNQDSNPDSNPEQEQGAEEQAETPKEPTREEIEAQFADTLAAAQQDALEQGKSEGYEQGLKEGIETGSKETKKTLNEAHRNEVMRMLEKIEERAAALQMNQESWFAERDNEIAAMVSQLMQRLVPMYTAKHGSAEILNFIKQVLSMITSKPKLQIQLPTSEAHLAPSIKKTLLKSGASFGSDEESFSISSTDALNPGECTVQWEGGKLERRNEAFWQKVDELINQIEPQENNEANNEASDGAGNGANAR